MCVEETDQVLGLTLLVNKLPKQNHRKTTESNTAIFKFWILFVAGRLLLSFSQIKIPDSHPKLKFWHSENEARVRSPNGRKQARHTLVNFATPFRVVYIAHIHQIALADYNKQELTVRGPNDLADYVYKCKVLKRA